MHANELICRRVAVVLQGRATASLEEAEMSVLDDYLDVRFAPKATQLLCEAAK